MQLHQQLHQPRLYPVVVVEDLVVEVLNPVVGQAVAAVDLQVEVQHQSNPESQGSRLHYSLHQPLTM